MNKHIKSLQRLIREFDGTTLSQEMKVLPKSAKSNKHPGWGPWKPLPNVSRFEVELSEYDPLFKEHGMDKKLPCTKLYAKYRNGRINRYLYHQIARLDESRSRNPEKYWTIANQLLCRSNVFAIQAIHHVFPKYHRELNYVTVLRLIWAMHKVARGQTVLDFKRVYIPKANGKWRPLGVPSPEWRLYLHQLNNLMYFYLAEHFHENQHAFLPNRGTLTAWMQILSKAINAPDIYEYDYKGFFDNIYNQEIVNVLFRMALPLSVANKLETIFRSAPKLPPKLLITEAQAKSKRVYQDLQAMYWPEGVGAHGMKDSGEYLTEEEWEDSKRGGLPAWLFGVPQGAPISPLLAIFPLSLLDKKVNLHRDRVRYADDFIEFPRGGATSQWQRLPKESILQKMPKAFTDWGIMFSKEKCGYIKRGGKWLKPLKFLGLVYDGLKDTLSAQTRGGSTLALSDKEEFLRAYFEQEEHKAKASASCEYCEGSGCSRCSPNLLYSFKGMKGYSWQQFVESRIKGFLQSRLYSGSWNSKDFEQSFELTFLKGSWMSVFEKHASFSAIKNMTVFNSTSIAAGLICKHIRVINRKRWISRELSLGRLTLEEANRRRVLMGLPPLSATYVKRLRSAIRSKGTHPDITPAPRTKQDSINMNDDARRYANWLFFAHLEDVYGHADKPKYYNTRNYLLRQEYRRSTEAPLWWTPSWVDTWD